MLSVVRVRVAAVAQRETGHQSRLLASDVAHPLRSGRNESFCGEDWASDAGRTDRTDRREPRCAADHRIRAECQLQTSPRRSALMLQPRKKAARTARRISFQTTDAHALG